MRTRIIRVGTAVASAALLVCANAGAQARQGRGAAGAGTAAAAKPPAPPVLYLSPAGVRQVQRALQAAGEKPGTVDGVWGDATAKALASFQAKKGIDPSGHIDVMTLGALGLGSLLTGDLPADSASQPLSADAMKSPGTELYVSPVFVRQVQVALQKKGAVPGNILGVWHDGSTQAALKFEKANGLPANGTFNLGLVHALDLDSKLVTPEAPARVPMLTDVQAPYGGSPIYVTEAGVRAIQQALKDKGQDIEVDGHWTPKIPAALKQFQQAQHLAPTGTLNLRTLRALGFAQPIPNLAEASAKS